MIRIDRATIRTAYVANGWEPSDFRYDYDMETVVLTKDGRTLKVMSDDDGNLAMAFHSAPQATDAAVLTDIKSVLAVIAA